jgi:hypothetical protein
MVQVCWGQGSGLGVLGFGFKVLGLGLMTRDVVNCAKGDADSDASRASSACTAAPSFAPTSSVREEVEERRVKGFGF